MGSSAEDRVFCHLPGDAGLSRKGNHMGRKRTLIAIAAVLSAAALAVLLGRAGGAQGLPAAHPSWTDAQLVSTSTTPPTQAQCNSVGRRCFGPVAIQAAYNVGPLYAAGVDGRGQTIAIVDSYGSDTMAHDLHVFDQAFGLQPMCGEESVTCSNGMPQFSQLTLQGAPATKAPPSQSNGTGQEDKSAWALEV